MGVIIKKDKARIAAKISAGNRAMMIAVTNAVIEYGNIYVREDQGALKDSALIASIPEEGKAIWDTPYAKRVYYTGSPSKDSNPNASLKWVEKGINANRKELNMTAQKAFAKGMMKD